jgi:hypothetical protein
MVRSFLSKLLSRFVRGLVSPHTDPSLSRLIDDTGSDSICNGRCPRRYRLLPSTLERPSLQMRRTFQSKEPILRGTFPFPSSYLLPADIPLDHLTPIRQRSATDPPPSNPIPPASTTSPPLSSPFKVALLPSTRPILSLLGRLCAGSFTPGRRTRVMGLPRS